MQADKFNKNKVLYFYERYMITGFTCLFTFPSFLTAEISLCFLEQAFLACSHLLSHVHVHVQVNNNTNFLTLGLKPALAVIFFPFRSEGRQM